MKLSGEGLVFPVFRRQSNYFDVKAEFKQRQGLLSDQANGHNLSAKENLGATLAERLERL